MIRHPAEVAIATVQHRLRAAAAEGRIDPRDAVLASVTASYFYLRRGLAALAFAFPIVLVVGAGWHHPQDSISAYYHYAGEGVRSYGAGTMRNVFVGVLWTVGAFLLLYKGYSTREDVALNIAGLAAPLIALFPTDWPGDEARSWIGTVHYASAVTYFLATAFVCIFCAGETVTAVADPRKQAMFRSLYRVYGWLMVAVPLGVIALHYAFDPGDRGRSWIILVEVAGIWIFAAFWLTKSREIAAIEAQPQRG